MFEFVRFYVVWLGISVVWWPVICRLGMSPYHAWLTARATAPFLSALLLMHILRWTALTWTACLFWVVFLVLLCHAIVLFFFCPARKPAESSAGRLPIGINNTRIILRKPARKAILKTELVLLLLGISFLALLGLHCREAYGERMMDLGLVTSLWRLKNFPPEDFWFAGRTLNTYYLGSWTVAAIGRGAFVKPWHAYPFGWVVTWLQAIAACLLAARIMRLRRSSVALVPLCVIFMGTGAFITSSIKHGSLFSEYPLIELARVIPYTINENPCVAFWISELHAHVMALPAMVAWVVLLQLSLERRSFKLAALGGVIASVIAMTDMWQVLPAATCAVFLLAPQARTRLPFILKAIPVMITSGILVAAAFMVDLQKYPTQLLIVRHSATTLRLLAILFGPLLAVIWAVLLERRHLRGTGTFLPLLLCAALIIISCELFYIDNRFPAPTERQNSVFRFHFAAWIYLALSLGAVWPRRFHNRFLKITAYVLITVFVFGGNWPWLLHLGQTRAGWTLDVRKALDANGEGRLEAAEWLFENTAPDTVIAESAGIPYRRRASVSAMSGRTAIFGERDKLRNHAVPRDEMRKRFAALTSIYANGPAAVETIRQLNVQYIILSPREIEAFPDTDAQTLLQQYPTVYQNKQTRILLTSLQASP